MTKHATGLAVGAALVLALSAAGVAHDDEHEDKETLEARKEVLDVLKAVEDGKDDKVLAAKAEAIRKKGVELSALMKAYKRKEKGGIGYGKKPDDKSGIEAKIIELARGNKGPSAETLRKEKKDLIKLAQLNLAMAEIARPHFRRPYKTVTREVWNRAIDDQKQAAKDLIEAVKKEDGKAVARAAKELLNSCYECHVTVHD